MGVLKKLKLDRMVWRLFRGKTGKVSLSKVALLVYFAMTKGPGAVLPLVAAAAGVELPNDVIAQVELPENMRGFLMDALLLWLGPVAVLDHVAGNSPSTNPDLAND